MQPSRPERSTSSGVTGAARAAVVAGALLGCGSHAPGDAPGDASSGQDASAGALEGGFEASAPSGPCDAVEQQHPIEGYIHVPVCSYTPYGTNPPSSGNHYPVWAAYQSYPAPVPEGFWVHNLEHGAIVITYNCPQGCAADVANAQAMLDALPADPTCTALGPGVQRRSVMTPDPKLDVPFAASAWGWTLRAKCFDAPTFESFAMRHYDQGREDLCEDGEDPLNGMVADCGDEQ